MVFCQNLCRYISVSLFSVFPSLSPPSLCVCVCVCVCVCECVCVSWERSPLLAPGTISTPGLNHQITSSTRTLDIYPLIAKLFIHLSGIFSRPLNLKSEPVEYRISVHLLGATSSHRSASYVLKRTAEDRMERTTTEAVEIVLNNFYVAQCHQTNMLLFSLRTWGHIASV